MNQFEKPTKRKAAGPDGLVVEMFLSSSHIVVPYLLKLFNCIFSAGVFLELWSKADIIPINNRNDADNDRGICNSVKTAEPGDRTTSPVIVMPECYASSQRVDSLARVVVTAVRHTHTRLHTPLSNICCFLHISLISVFSKISNGI